MDGEYVDDCPALMMEAVSTSETSVNFYQITLRNVAGDKSSEILKSDIFILYSTMIAVCPTFCDIH
jgi:hypothetical protein